MWSGHYHPGRRSQREPVVVEATAGGLSITTEDGQTIYWKYTEARRSRKQYRGKLRLEHGNSEAAEVLTMEEEALDDIRKYAPGFASHANWKRLSLIGIAVALLACIPTVYQIVLSRGIQFLSGYAPLEMEELVGSKVLTGLAPDNQQCTDSRLYTQIERLISKLAATVPPVRYQFKLVVLDDVRMNSCALPGGYLMLSRGLIARMKGPEEMAAVLAHEMGHLISGHPRAIVFRKLAGPGFLFLAAGTGRENVAKLAEIIPQWSYSAAQEEEADVAAMKLLTAAHWDAQAMVRLFRDFQQHELEMPEAALLLSSHVRTAALTQALEAAAPPPTYVPEKIPEREVWKTVTLACASALDRKLYR